jgi:membrane-associated protease RseP (regulator of RpoE activity)
MRGSPAAVVTEYTSVGSPAQLAGLPIGGRITKVNAVAVANKKELVAQLQASGGSNPVVFTIDSVVLEIHVAAIAICDFVGAKDDDLPFAKGDIIAVTSQPNGVPRRLDSPFVK